MSKITHVRLENFTAFAYLDQEFSPGINIFIGENGTGKTHLLKLLYTACAITTGEDAEKGLPLKLRQIFSPYAGEIDRLIRKQPSETSKDQSTIAITRDNRANLVFNLSKNNAIKIISQQAWSEIPQESTYIPVKEMLAHAPGFLSAVSKRELAFEEVYTDIIKRAFLPKLKEIPEGYTDLVASLHKAIGGKITQKGEYFFIENEHGEFEFTLLAEGLRKLALLLLLIQNGTLQPDSILFWDEPEANLNPALMGQVVEVILELQRLGVQVFLTTHNYVLLKEFDLRKKESDKIRYISMYFNGAGAVSTHASDSYTGIDPNAIAATFDSLYDREIERNLGGL